MILVDGVVLFPLVSIPLSAILFDESISASILRGASLVILGVYVGGHLITDRRTPRIPVGPADRHSVSSPSSSLPAPRLSTNQAGRGASSAHLPRDAVHTLSPYMTQRLARGGTRRRSVLFRPYALWKW